MFRNNGHKQWSEIMFRNNGQKQMINKLEKVSRLDSKSQKSKIHEGHRARMRERVQDSGMESLQDHEILEYILYSFVPRKDTNELAHILLNEFGGLANVFNAEAENLMKIKGITKNSAIFIANLPDIFRRYAVDTQKEKLDLSGRGIAREYLRRQMIYLPIEHVHVVALDVNDNLIKTKKIAKGTGHSVNIPVRTIVEFALNNNASSIIIAHNHPSGNSHPSQQDFILTRDLAWTLASVGVQLLDHYIFSNETYYSFDEQDKLRQMYEEKDITLKDGLIFYE